MKAKLGIGTAALALILSGCGGEENSNLTAASANQSAPVDPIAAPNNGDWSEMVAETEQGGFRMGNPDAPVKLVEYASVSCPHCATFSEEASDPLRELVRTGRISWEFRPFMLNALDPGIFMLLRCQGPAPFFPLVEQVFANQSEWAGRTQSITPDQASAIENMSPTARSAALVQAMEMDQFFRQRGMPEARINSCLADASVLERLAEITQYGVEQDQVQGTPTFLVNGETVQASDWASLEPQLRAAMAR